ncbi:uncharacterized protein AMSG_05931 [Thecamonas trahens ATCC 50062]|uniref:TRP C-terminal domain-containing protein n=1 Tax=Thecamonas trahens ATCC 50062 TaxID=461836 RepID=A0A0L0DBR6_THETB|nr:hypothetical protein AMSG_05931 [Thecamonas trahens ATCC 50062]KNC49670.1 hypothetical protein AMSG_05931 [Thecamonas trahens ATCC 50062]|eukprot:XP_013757468.1 hypothetical protein AMSG_05931 [Thecamonas trahens ATCC 50062]
MHVILRMVVNVVFGPFVAAQYHFPFGSDQIEGLAGVRPTSSSSSTASYSFDRPTSSSSSEPASSELPQRLVSMYPEQSATMSSLRSRGKAAITAEVLLKGLHRDRPVVEYDGDRRKIRDYHVTVFNASRKLHLLYPQSDAPDALPRPWYARIRWGNIGMLFALLWLHLLFLAFPLGDDVPWQGKVVNSYMRSTFQVLTLSAQQASSELQWASIAFIGALITAFLITHAYLFTRVQDLFLSGPAAADSASASPQPSPDREPPSPPPSINRAIATMSSFPDLRVATLRASGAAIVKPPPAAVSSADEQQEEPVLRSSPRANPDAGPHLTVNTSLRRSSSDGSAGELTRSIRTFNVTTAMKWVFKPEPTVMLVAMLIFSRNFAAVTSCVPLDGQDPSDTRLYLHFDPEVQCFAGMHRIYFVATLYALLFSYPLFLADALHVYFADLLEFDGLEPKYAPQAIVLEKIIVTILGAISVTWSDSPARRLWFFKAAVLAVMVITAVTRAKDYRCLLRPGQNLEYGRSGVFLACSVAWVVILRLFLFLLALCSGVAAQTAVALDDPSSSFPTLVFSVLLVISVAVFAAISIWWYRRETPFEHAMEDDPPVTYYQYRGGWRSPTSAIVAADAGASPVDTLDDGGPIAKVALDLKPRSLVQQRVSSVGLELGASSTAAQFQPMSSQSSPVSLASFGAFAHTSSRLKLSPLVTLATHAGLDATQESDAHSSRPPSPRWPEPPRWV